jgi:chaperonin GroEL
VKEGLKNISEGANPVEVKRGIDNAVTIIVKKLKELAQDITTEEQIAHVAAISGNNDAEIGTLIATALDKVGRDGVVSIEESKTGETVLEVVEGMQFERGYKSPYFVTNNNTMNAVLEDPYVLIYDGRITTAAELVPVLTKANTENKSLLIVAEDIDGEALATLIVNKMRGIVNVVAVKAPDFGERKTLILEDLAIITGGEVISKDKGYKLDKLVPQQLHSFLGKARTVTVSKDKTTIVDGRGEEAAIEARAQSLKEQIDNAQSFYEKEKLQERLGKLIGGVAIVSVGGNSEVEMKEKKDRVEDALFATKAALEQGIVPGGGLSLIRAFNAAIYDVDSADDNTIRGFKILKKACYAPFIKILDNAGQDNWYEVLHEVLNGGDDDNFLIYNVKTSTIANAITEGLLDPVKVTRTALENAASVAGTILTTESVVFEKRDEKKKDEGFDMSSLGM